MHASFRLILLALLPLTGFVHAAPVEPPPTGPSGERFSGQGLKVLLVGGGSSHDFETFFHRADTAILKGAGHDVAYSSDPDEILALLPQAEVLVLSANQKALAAANFQEAVKQFLAAGKGVIALHPGVWYNWKETDFNAKVLGGGASSHDPVGKFTVTVTKPEHPVMKGVPAAFEVEDELYHATPVPGAKWETLATTSNSAKTGQPYPSVWVISNEPARFLAIALGHDARVHDLPAFKALLINGVNWVARK